MAIQTGQRTSGNIASTQRKIDMQEKILLLEPEAAPLTVILQRTKKGSLRERAIDTKFSWHNDEAEGRFDAINNAAGYTNAATSVVVDTGTLFAVDDLVLVPRTAEILQVEAISTNTLTVERGWGDTSGAAIVDNDPLLIIGTAATEGSTSYAARTENPIAVDNYTQIFRNSVEESGSLLSSSNETEPHDWAHQSKKVGIEHLKDMEYAFLFGTPSAGTQRSTGGLRHFLTQNNQDAGGVLSEAELEQFMRTVSRYGSDTKTVLASALVISVINNFSVGRMHTSVGDKTYGVKVMEYISAHGTLNLVKHHLLEGAIYGGYAFAVDFKQGNVKYRFLNGMGPGPSRDTKLLTNRQENDRDGRKDEYLTEAGFQVGTPKMHGVLTGVTS